MAGVEFEEVLMEVFGWYIFCWAEAECTLNEGEFSGEDRIFFG